MEIYTGVYRGFQEPKFYRETKFGYRIVKRFIDTNGRRYVIVHRQTKVVDDYAVGCGYDEKDGLWAQGYYDFTTAYEAEEYLKQHYRVKRI